jgi:glycosyltransferase involved in cell wall biosynthesis
MPLRVGVNAMFLDPGRSGGPETYLRGLVPAIAEQFPDITLEIATTHRGANALRADGFEQYAQIHELPADEGQRARRLYAEQVLIPRLAWNRGWDVIHSLANTGPLSRKTPHVLTLHDVTFFRHRTLSLVSTIGLRPLVRRTARRATLIVTGAEAAKQEIVKELGIDPARIVAVPHGPGRPPAEPATEDETRAKHQLDGQRVVLSVGAIRPHKNQALLVNALEFLPDFTLVLAGIEEQPLETAMGGRDAATKDALSDRIRVTGYVPDDELEALWRLAECAAFPTLAEGFGLPVLEAIRRGVPVACSDLPVLREVGGDVPHYFDPRDAEAAAGAIRAAAVDERARTAGPERARLFTWERAARETVDAYRRALG